MKPLFCPEWWFLENGGRGYFSKSIILPLGREIIDRDRFVDARKKGKMRWNGFRISIYTIVTISTNLIKGEWRIC